MSEKTSCGLDFGTTNSALGILEDGQSKLVALEDIKLQIPSAVFYDFDDKQKYFGNTGIERYLEGNPGRIIWSPKNVLGTSLMEEKTQIGARQVRFREIITQILQNIKETAERNSGRTLKNVVSGRPVHFCDDNNVVDQNAQKLLEDILKSIGFEQVIFEYEPIAAALAYERTILHERMALVVDIGGGTSDFSIIKVSPEGSQRRDRSNDILAVGGVHIAGTDFDQKLSRKMIMPELGMGATYKGLEGKWGNVPLFFYHDLSTWHKINSLYLPRNIEFAKRIAATSSNPEMTKRLVRVLEGNLGHNLFRQVEQAKIRLSEQDKVDFEFDQVSPEIVLDITRQNLNEAISDLVGKIEVEILDVIISAQIDETSINALLFTGGGTMIPTLRERVASMLPSAEVIDIDKFGSVAKGLTIKAQTVFK